jgi:hypothetical protein
MDWASPAGLLHAEQLRCATTPALPLHHAGRIASSPRACSTSGVAVGVQFIGIDQRKHLKESISLSRQPGQHVNGGNSPQSVTLIAVNAIMALLANAAER